MSSYVNPALRGQLEALPIELKNRLLSHNVRIDTERELNAALKALGTDKYLCKATEPDISATASATECTGLMPSLPQSNSEVEAYKELFSMEIPKAENGELNNP